MEIQGPSAGQRHQDGGPGLLGAEDGEEAPGAAPPPHPVYMVVSLGEPPRPSPTPEQGLPGFVTVRLENGVLSLENCEAPGTRPQPRAGSSSAPATPHQSWAGEEEPCGSGPGAQGGFADPLEDVDMVLKDEQVAGFLVEDIGELQVNLGEALDLARKGVLLVFRCPEPGCAKAFDRKQQLKVHLLSHTEERRPYKCQVEECGWSFTTLYKLKRHLQSHDKQRPFPCQAPGCSKSFTTVYNLKAHLKAHEQENLFRCEACGEAFPTATKLGAHRRTHIRA